ncbi:MAG: hypothetical protein QME51_08135 [Planctomycetota bacterium]|nr:hypothetical protein [Planctomycetota bacterium]
MTELSIQDLETTLRLLPQKIQEAGQELIEAENKLSMVEAQLLIERAKIRIAHADEDLPSKTIEAYTIVGTETLAKEVIELTRIVEVKKLAKEMLENKYISCRKISSLRQIYQPL